MVHVRDVHWRTMRCRAVCITCAAHAHVKTRARHMMNVNTYCVSRSCDVVRCNLVFWRTERHRRNLSPTHSLQHAPVSLLSSEKYIVGLTLELHVHWLHRRRTSTASSQIKHPVLLLQVIHSVSRDSAPPDLDTDANGRDRKSLPKPEGVALQQLADLLSTRNVDSRSTSAPRAASSKRPRLSPNAIRGPKPVREFRSRPLTKKPSMGGYDQRHLGLGL